MADWTNYPRGQKPPADNTATGAPPWTTHIQAVFDQINPPPKVFQEHSTVAVEGPVDRIVEGADNPEPWTLAGNRRKGPFDWNYWTRKYPFIKIQRYMKVTIRYYLHTGKLAGHAILRPVHVETFWVPQGNPQTVKGATIYVAKLASIRRKGVYVKVNPRLQISARDVELGEVSVEGLDWAVAPDEEMQIDTPPPDDPIPPDDARVGDPARELQQAMAPVQWVDGGILASLKVRVLDAETGLPAKKALLEVNGKVVGVLSGATPEIVTVMIENPVREVPTLVGGRYGSLEING